MIALGMCVGSDDRVARWVLPTITRNVGGDTPILQRRDATSITSAYNSILDEASRLDALEALVLIHDDVEIRDERFVEKLRQVLADRSVGLVGVLGARNVTSIAYWEGHMLGRLGVDTPNGERIDDFGAETADVDAVDGCFLALSPQVVREVRFDERRFPAFHGYDIDFSFSVRDHGQRVVVADLHVHHHRRDGFPDRLGWRKADIQWRTKWGLEPRATMPVRLGLLHAESNWASARRRLARVTRQPDREA